MNFPAFLLWTRNQPFPREVQLNRTIVKSEQELLQAYTQQNFYSSIFNLRQIFYEEYDTLFFDIDGKQGGVTESFGKLETFLKNVEGQVSRLYFSGVGFHVFIDLEKVIQGKENYRHFSKQFAEHYNLLDLIDHSALGDVRRVARVPFSTNTKSMKVVVPLDPENLTKQKVLECSTEKKEFVPPILHKFSFNFTPTPSPPTTPKLSSSEEFNWEGIYPPCINNAENLLYNAGELGHSSRIHLATFLIQIGREEELHKYLEKANDYKEDVSNYQISHLRNGNYMPFKCNNVPDEICSYKSNKRDCPFFPYVFKNIIEEVVK